MVEPKQNNASLFYWLILITPIANSVNNDYIIKQNYTEYWKDCAIRKFKQLLCYF